MAAILQGVLMVSLGLRGPDSLPGSREMLVLCLVPWAAVTAIGYLMLLPAPALFVLPVAAFELLLLLGYSRFVLWMAGKPERWPQTLVSLLGVQAIINALNLPLVYVVTSQEQPGLLIQAAEYGFLAWWLLAMGNIFARAMDRGIWAGLLLSVAHFFLYMILYVALTQLFGIPLEAS
ncbi:MAG: hypothetical protein F4Y31_01850 [Gammaproteobacteria bacterium]|nr:hypothetical protein [Gammaproteobacteria bacterium]MYF66803.1 hypothetical protein [Gammaproteobacteria bacterium]MYK37313.1 hypothetical protein [Gammaproteobacteria bacterium]